MAGMELPEAGKDHYDVMALNALQAGEGAKITYRDKEPSKGL